MLKIAALWILFLGVNHLAISDEINSQSTIPLSKKLYLNGDQIRFIDNKICIEVEGYVYETPAIHADEIGYYIDKVAQSGHCAWYEWECKWENCLYCNLRGIDVRCGACGRDMSGNR